MLRLPRLPYQSEGRPEKLRFGKDVPVRKEAAGVEIEEDQTKRGYLHLKPGSPGANLGAGLFTK